jgi:hypothetical protein
MPVMVGIAIGHSSITIGIRLSGSIFFDERKWHTQLKAAAEARASTRRRRKTVFRRTMMACANSFPRRPGTILSLPSRSVRLCLFGWEFISYWLGFHPGRQRWRLNGFSRFNPWRRRDAIIGID